MKVILIAPSSPWLISDQVEIPLGILYLASWIRNNGYDVEVIDLSGNKELDVIPEADIYGIGFVTPQFQFAVKILKQIKATYPLSVVIAGGPHATALPQDVLYEGFDAVVRGEGENAILDILRNGITKPIYDITYMQDLDLLPFPAWDLINMENYVPNIGVVGYMNTSEKREINMIATRGCTGKCAYCTKYKGPLRWRSIENIKEEIIILVDKYKVNRIFFVDDNIVINKPFLKSICSLMKDLSLPWHCLGRADQVNEGICMKMKDSGCMGIDFGIESGSQKILNIINKGTTVEQQANGIKSAYTAGLKVRAQFMVGLPQETDDDHKENIKFMNNYGKYVAKWGIHIFVPYPTCDIWDNPNSYGYNIGTNPDFSTFQTIGKPGEWNYVPENSIEINRRRDEIIKLIKEKNIFVGDKCE